MVKKQQAPALPLVGISKRGSRNLCRVRQMHTVTARQPLEMPSRAKRCVLQHCWSHTCDRALALHQDTLLSFAVISKSQGMVHRLPATEIPGTTTTCLLYKLKPVVLRVEKPYQAAGSMLCRPQADVTVPFTYLIISNMHFHRIPSDRMCRDGIFSSIISQRQTHVNQ